MAKKREICVIIGSAPMDRDAFQDVDMQERFVICADGGYDNAQKLGIRPDLLIGDFDSIQNRLPENVETIRLKIEKDDTDTLAAVKEGLQRGYRRFELGGVLGGDRFDHSYANLCVLQYLSSQGCKAVILDGSRKVFLLKGGRLTLSRMKGCTVSVFPFGCSSCEVTYTGLQYPLRQAILYSEVPLGVSNCITDDMAQIIVHSGDALVIVQK
ncbi:MAG: thiamine diphosphokinase [Oscillospiraceae bacterium]|jgi:thiamine pyrophosphokinase|nr:thiamine diphosphokinase [Oscillospiraceae bacterium]MCI2035363.1 thiamine diphosphokinase [Oscillospiraceae bacterium]